MTHPSPHDAVLLSRLAGEETPPVPHCAAILQLAGLAHRDRETVIALRLEEAFHHFMEGRALYWAGEVCKECLYLTGCLKRHPSPTWLGRNGAK
ncbi:MAG: hypothetical protein HQL51_05425 [Magnetococcales bacterium]|nr:hypothetical protein [Magnetococcales bacterium]